MSSDSRSSSCSPVRTTDEFYAEELLDIYHRQENLFDINWKKSFDDATEKYNRKEKSLGQLSKKFLSFFGTLENCEVSLDTVTSQLGVERRRIYDIINILESLGVVFRRGKNHYYWIGLHAIKATIETIKKSP